MSVNLNYVASHRLCVKFLILIEVIKIYLSLKYFLAYLGSNVKTTSVNFG